MSEAFDLGADYTRPVTRAQLARMTVDLVIGQQQSTLAELAGQLGIELEMAPLTPRQSRTVWRKPERRPRARRWGIQPKKQGKIRKLWEKKIKKPAKYRK